MKPADHNTGLVELIQKLRDDSLHLLRQEVALAKTEMCQKLERKTRSLVGIVAGGLLLYAGALVMLHAMSVLVSWGLRRAALSAELAAWLGPAIVGGMGMIVGAAIALTARATMKRSSIVPEETIESLRTNKNWIRGKVY